MSSGRRSSASTSRSGPTTSGRSTATASSAASAKPSGRRSAVIRLAVRCAPDQADLVLAELTVLAPNGVEEEHGPGYVEYAIYGGEGELPELGEIDAVVGGRPIEVSSTVIPDDWADRWRDFHKPLLVGGRLWLRPSWEPQRGGALDAVGALTDLGTGSGVLAIAAAKLGWSPVTGYDHEQAAIEASAANATVNDVT